MPPLPLPALSGRVVTMDARDTVYERGFVYLGGGEIRAMLPASQAPPVEFADLRPVSAAGTPYPGLIEAAGRWEAFVALWRSRHSYRPERGCPGRRWRSLGAVIAC